MPVRRRRLRRGLGSRAGRLRRAAAEAGSGRCDAIGPALGARARVELLGLRGVAEVALPDVGHHDVGARALLGRLGERGLLLAELEHGLPAAARSRRCGAAGAVRARSFGSSWTASV
jgi:hypothetical protein